MTVATRILAHLGLLAAEGRVALLVGCEVVYLCGRGASVATMTPYDVAAVRLGDGLELAGAPPADTERYLAALRATGSRAVAGLASGEMAVAPDAAGLVELVTGLRWADAEGRARSAGALLGAYATEG